MEKRLKSEYTDALEYAEFLKEVYLERGMLYGILIYLLKFYDKKKLEIPEEEILPLSKFMISIVPNKDEKKLVVEMLLNPDYKEQSKGNEDE